MVLVEFAFVLPLLLTLVLGIMDFGRALNYWIYQTHLSDEGARYAVVNTWPGCDLSVSGLCAASTCPATAPDPASTDGRCLQKYIRDQVLTKELKSSASNPNGGVKVCVDFPNGGAPIAGDPVKVTVSFAFKWLGFFKGYGTSTIGNSATMRLEVTPTHFISGCYPT